MSLWCCSSLLQTQSSQRSRLATGCLHFLLCHLARRSYLGVYRRGLSKPCARQGAESRIVVSLDHERYHLADFSHSCEVLRWHSLCLLCCHDGTSIFCSAVHLPGDKRHFARAVAA